MMHCIGPRFTSALLVAVLSLSSGCSWRGQKYSHFNTQTPFLNGEVLVLGFLGGRDSWQDTRVGVGRLAHKLRAEKMVGMRVEAVENMKRKLALRLVRESLDRDRNGKLDAAEKSAARIILYGQSFGGAAVVKFARQLEKLNVPVLLTVQVDSVGIGDALIPANVRTAANLYQRNGAFVKGERRIRPFDPQRTRILFNREFDYRDSKISLAHLPWHKKLIRSAHVRMDTDPAVWSEVERLIRAAIAGVSSAQSQDIN
jgi:hypothetical protein